MSKAFAEETGAMGPFPLRLGGYAVDILVQGFPGKSTHNGGLGWSTVVLLRGHGRVALIDTGTFGLRKTLIERLAALGLAPEEVTDLVLSHAHYDHIVNYPLFPAARPMIGVDELEWALTTPPGRTVVPELYVQALSRDERLRKVADGEEILPNITAHLAPGHTPGHLLFVLRGEARDVIFVQDAVKTRAELVSGETDMTFDAAVSAATVAMVWSLWRRRPGTILVPGHDLPMVLDGGEVVLLGRRLAGVTATFGETLQDVTRFPLVAPGTA